MKSILLFAVCLVGCSAPSIGTAASDNAEIRIDVMANLDGCRVYRMVGDGYPFHFVVCRDKAGVTEPVSTNESREHCTTTSTGKTTTTHCIHEDVNTPTVRGAP